ncbi:hypothetical protein VTJ83DRAFT_7270 [Remersonia thermophila]|uniref:Uncharacterized protein n=1 Tax=Remersonia thermophila TaxID=72144 RepID=A0ABR4D317_9PEZI
MGSPPAQPKHPLIHDSPSLVPPPLKPNLPTAAPSHPARPGQPPGNLSKQPGQFPSVSSQMQSGEPPPGGRKPGATKPPSGSMPLPNPFAPPPLRSEIEPMADPTRNLRPPPKVEGQRPDLSRRKPPAEGSPNLGAAPPSRPAGSSRTAQANVHDAPRSRQPQAPPPRPAKPPPPSQSASQRPAPGQAQAGVRPPPSSSMNPQSAPRRPLGAQRPAASGPPGTQERLASPPPPLAARAPAVPGPPPGERRPPFTSPPPPLRRTPTTAAAVAASPPPPANRPPPRAPPPPPPPPPAARPSPPSCGTWNEKRGGGYSTDTDAEHREQSPYAKLLLSLDRIPRSHTMAATLFAWLLLAGFVIVPGSFTSPDRAPSSSPPTQQQPPPQPPQRRQPAVELPPLDDDDDDDSGRRVPLSPANTACVVLGFLLVLVGSFGAAWLALRWRRHHIWLLNKLYAPLVLHALAGGLATVAAVYAQHGGRWCPQAVVTGVVESVVFAVSFVLLVLYNQSLLRILRKGGVVETKEKGRKGAKGEGPARFPEG